MHIKTSFKIILDSAADSEKFARVLMQYLDDEIVIRDNAIEVDETYRVYHISGVKELFEKVVEGVDGIPFSGTGVIDTSESAGEYMDFAVKSDGKTLTVSYSGWYIIFYGTDYDDMEEDELQEYVAGNFPEKSYEDFVKLRDKWTQQYESAENGEAEYPEYYEYEGDIIEKVPLDNTDVIRVIEN